ncbi:MAG TPA: glycoside hydrolase family 95 protein, partial [Fimbriimonas sp.]|nr:glycoside hydrolase family 95 protein [Fimbriimonas sp.]
MSFRSVICLVLGVAFMSLASDLLASGSPPTHQTHITFEHPAKDWNEALPIGNGRMGAMIFGGVKNERYQLNDSTFWAGHPHDYSVPGSADQLAEIRKLLFAGKESEASGLADRAFMGNPKFQAAYQSAGDLFLDFDHERATNKVLRGLDVRTGLATVVNPDTKPDIRESFASFPHQVIAIRVQKIGPGTLNFAARLVSEHSFRMDKVDANTVMLRGQWRDDGKKAAWTASWEKPGIRLAIGLRVITKGGECVATSEGFQVKNANSAMLLLTTGTSFVNYKDISGDETADIVPNLDKATALGYEKLKKAHLADMAKLLGKATLSLEKTTNSDKPTPERLEGVRKGQADPSLAALYFNFGRYLLAACSRPGGQAANLQGLWNKDRRPAWGSKYTTNINLQMNYWPAEVANLGECTEPLFSLIDDLRVTGAKTARDYYN